MAYKVLSKDGIDYAPAAALAALESRIAALEAKPAKASAKAAKSAPVDDGETLTDLLGTAE